MSKANVIAIAGLTLLAVSVVSGAFWILEVGLGVDLPMFAWSGIGGASGAALAWVILQGPLRETPSVGNSGQGCICEWDEWHISRGCPIHGDRSHD